jgi:microcystin-dependent protein
MPGTAEFLFDVTNNPVEGALGPGQQGGTSTVAAHTHAMTTSNSGLGTAHLNVQPTIICNYIIKL